MRRSSWRWSGATLPQSRPRMIELDDLHPARRARGSRDMSLRPHVICHMLVSLDGRIHPSRWTESPDGVRGEWSKVYEKVHEALGGQAWLVGRITMAEMNKIGAHPPAGPFQVERPHHFA